MRIFATSRPATSAEPSEMAADMDEEIAKGRQFYREGLIVEAYMNPDYTRTFMILEAPSIEAARLRFNEYPQVRKELITFEFTPLIGMPAIAQVHDEERRNLPSWWPDAGKEA